MTRSARPSPQERRFRRQIPPWVVFAVGLSLIAVWFADYLSGAELTFSIFYLLPVSIAAWHLGQRPGLLVSALSALGWFYADALTATRYSHPLVPYWNGFVSLGFYVITALSISALRQAMRTQEQLVHFVVHDLRAPLTTLQMALHTLIEDHAGEAPEDHRRLMDISLVSCDRAMGLVNSLLDLSRLERGRMPVHPSETEVAKLIEQSIGDIAVWAETQRVTIHREIALEPSTIVVDHELTRRILTNLLSNALKHSPEGSEIVVAFAPFDAGTVAFSVTDRGPGVPAAWVNRVFDKFVQVDAHRAGAAIGTGLGLAFCRLGVEAQHGRIRMESEPNQRTTVIFTLPVAPIR